MHIERWKGLTASVAALVILTCLPPPQLGTGHPPRLTATSADGSAFDLIGHRAVSFASPVSLTASGHVVVQPIREEYATGKPVLLTRSELIPGASLLLDGPARYQVTYLLGGKRHTLLILILSGSEQWEPDPVQSV